MLSSGAVWLLTSTEHGLKQKMEHSLSLPLEHASVPSQVTPPLPRISVSWTQPQSSASPSRSQVVSGHPPGALASDQNYVASHLPEIFLLWHFRRPNIFSCEDAAQVLMYVCPCESQVEILSQGKKSLLQAPFFTLMKLM